MAVKTKKTEHFDKHKAFTFFDYEPRPDQLEIHDCKAKIRVIDAGVRWGKSKLAAFEGLVESQRNPRDSIGWIVAPSYDLANKVFREVYRAVVEKIHQSLVLEASEAKMRIRFVNIWGFISEIKGKSGDNPDSLLGESLDWVVLDEAARLKPTIWDSHISQRLIDKKGWALMISTPKGKNWFYQNYLRGLDPLNKRIQSFHHPTSNNPIIDPLDIEQEKASLPESVFRQEYLAEFIEGGGLVFKNVRACIQGALMKPSPTQSYVMGVDLAKLHDFTVMCVMDDKGRLVEFERFNKIDWELQKRRIKIICDKYNKAPMIVDATGMGGDMFVESLMRDGYPVMPFTFTEGSKRDLIDNLIVKIENSEIRFPNIPELIHELEAFEYQMTATGRLKRSAPIGFYDDCVIALALACWQISQGCFSIGEVETFGEVESLGMYQDTFV